MSESDRQQWFGRAESLREELAVIPRHHWNVIKIRDREQKLARIEARLAHETRSHQSFLNRRAELAARFYAFAANGGGR